MHPKLSVIQENNGQENVSYIHREFLIKFDNGSSMSKRSNDTPVVCDSKSCNSLGCMDMAKWASHPRLTLPDVATRKQCRCLHVGAVSAARCASDATAQLGPN